MITAPDPSDLKTRAREIYITMPVARYTTIADRLRVPREQIMNWAKDENWLALRAAHAEERSNQLAQQIGDPNAISVRLWKLAELAAKQIETQLEQRTSVETIANLVPVISRLYRLQKSLRKDLL
jgi:hypothetical protein